ncbi:hypothetical protein Hanom_Chr12g01141751 [Helianthus anomalus]
MIFPSQVHPYISATYSKHLSTLHVLNNNHIRSSSTPSYTLPRFHFTPQPRTRRRNGLHGCRNRSRNK